MLIVDKYKIAYLHINKTAGTSIRRFIKDLVGEKNIKEMGPTHGPLATSSRFLGRRFKDYTILTSIRSPRARLMSIYLFRKMRFRSGEISPVMEAAQELTFKEWFMDIIRYSTRLTDMSLSDSILVDGEFMPNVYIVAAETLQRDMLKFSREMLGIEPKQEVPYLNKTNFIRDHYVKYFDDEFNKAVYEWDKWIIDNYYPWFLDTIT